MKMKNSIKQAIISSLLFFFLLSVLNYLISEFSFVSLVISTVVYFVLMVLINIVSIKFRKKNVDDNPKKNT